MNRCKDNCIDETNGIYHNDCACDILKSQAVVAECEAKLFCKVMEELYCELNKAKGLNQLKCVIGLANSFLLSSAEKEKAMAKVINACKGGFLDHGDCISK